jgi:hypothetical protein
MPIIGLTFRSVDAKREKEQIKDEIKVNSSPRINSIKTVNVSTINKEVLSLSFDFVTRYDPQIGEIKIGGELLYLTDKNKELLKQWEKEKKLPEKVSLEILNYLFRRCLLKVSNIADDLQLPPPVPLPKITPKTK